MHPVLAEASMELHIRGLGDILPSAVIRSKTKMLLCPYFFFPAKFCPYPSGRIFPQLVPGMVLMDTMPQIPCATHISEASAARCGQSQTAGIQVKGRLHGKVTEIKVSSWSLHS